MHYKEHLLFSGIVNGIFLFVACTLFKINLFEPSLFFPLIATFYIFSLLPDIDHPRSHISGILFLLLFYLFASSAYDLYKTFDLFNLIKMGIAFGIFIVHASYAEDSYLHRRFPHTFTFGAIASIILYFLVNSILEQWLEPFHFLHTF